MSIAAVTQVYEETRRLSIAGGALAAGDFRLKKLIEPLKKSAAKAPVFGKVAESVEKVVDGPEKETIQSLLELSTLVHAILYTQGETGAKGRMTAIKTADLNIPAANTSARVLKPLIEALTETGSGRLEIIRDAIERDAFKDIRLVNPALQAIDDVYGEIGDMVAEQILPGYGAAILPELRAKFDPKGKTGHIRRLKLMHHLDPDATKDLVELSLESGAKEMKIAALSCLKDSKEHLSYMLEQASARAKDVRTAALESMAQFKDDAVVEVFQKALSGADVDIAAGPASDNPSPKLKNFILEDAQRQFDELFTTKNKTQLKKLRKHFHSFLSCFLERKDKKATDFLSACFDRRDELLKLKGDTSGQDICWKITAMMVLSGSKPLSKKVAEAHAELNEDFLDCCFAAAVQTKKPAEVYDEFSPYLQAKPDARSTAGKKRDMLENLLLCRGQYRYYYRYAYRRHRYRWGFEDEGTLNNILAEADYDSRWLDAAVEAGELGLIDSLLQPGHAGAHEFLQKEFDKLLKKRDIDYDLHHVMRMMIDSKFDEDPLIENYIAAMKKAGNPRRRSYYGMWWLSSLMGRLPKKAAAKIEEAMQGLSEKAIEQLADSLVELKRKKN